MKPHKRMASGSKDDSVSSETTPEQMNNGIAATEESNNGTTTTGELLNEAGATKDATAAPPVDSSEVTTKIYENENPVGSRSGKYGSYAAV